MSIPTIHDVMHRLHVMDAKLDKLLALTQQEIKQMSKFDDSIAQLKTDVTNLTTAEQSAIALINGIKGQIDAAVQAALAAGATDVQLAALKDLSVAVETGASDLAAAVAANTPPAPPEPPPVPPVELEGRARQLAEMPRMKAIHLPWQAILDALQKAGKYAPVIIAILQDLFGATP